MAVSFTGEDMLLTDEEYRVERSPVGLVYIPVHAVEVDEEAAIRYERYPWIEKFELDGIRPVQLCCIWQPGMDAAQAKTQE